MREAKMERGSGSCVVQVIGIILGSVATILSIAVCAMPHWKVSILMESNAYGKRIDGGWISRWDGLWLTCVRQTNSPTSCQPYTTSISITPDLKAARVLISFAVLFSIFGFINVLTSIFYNSCCRKNRWNQNCLLLTAGISFFLSGTLILISVTWTASNIMREVCFSSCKSVQQQEIGEAIFLGWPTVLLFYLSGSIFCWYHPCMCRQRAPVPEPDSVVCNEEDACGRELRTYRYSRASCDE
ncbi:claudin-8-like [Discoglossus pictus]